MSSCRHCPFLHLTVTDWMSVSPVPQIKSVEIWSQMISSKEFTRPIVSTSCSSVLSWTLSSCSHNVDTVKVTDNLLYMKPHRLWCPFPQASQHHLNFYHSFFLKYLLTYLEYQSFSVLPPVSSLLCGSQLWDIYNIYNIYNCDCNDISTQSILFEWMNE